MSCEDCKNYEKKEESTALAAIRRTCIQYCEDKSCAICELKIPLTCLNCPVYLIGKGGYK
ncbi:hypothetical protein LCGC14_1986670 [marine sediment metagenome]|uniref:Uncharacterized protein n=1 Tax=marine sediment metagenome TaxID=412755 RepID=A0A0F9FVF2_9ZZZZ